MFIVTGGGSGIGRALALELANRGKEVLIVGRRQSALEDTANFSSLISIACADLTTAKGRNAIVSQVEQRGKLEGLVHNAGTIEPILPLAAIDEESWRLALETNLNAPLFLSQLLLNKLKGSRVLHIGTGAAHFPVSGWAAYCASKAALAMLTRCWQLESREVAFASVMPGIIDTDMQAFIRQAKHMDTEKLDFFKQLKRENRLLNPATVAAFFDLVAARCQF